MTIGIHTIFAAFEVSSVLTEMIASVPSWLYAVATRDNERKATSLSRAWGLVEKCPIFLKKVDVWSYAKDACKVGWAKRGE